MNRIVLFVVATLSFQCSNPVPHEGKEVDDASHINDTISTAAARAHTDASKAGVNVFGKHIDTAIVITDTTTLELTEITRVCPEEKSTIEGDYVQQCRQWHLDPAQIVEAVRTFKPITGYDVHYGYLTFECWYECKLKIGNMVYQLKLNAGSYFYLSNADTTYIMGDEKGRLRKYFVAGADEENYNH